MGLVPRSEFDWVTQPDQNQDYMSLDTISSCNFDSDEFSEGINNDIYENLARKMEIQDHLGQKNKSYLFSA